MGTMNEMMVEKMEERKIIKITQEMRDALHEEPDFNGPVIYRITDVIEETMNMLGEYVRNEEDEEETQRGEELLRTLAELYISLSLDNAERIQEQVIKNIVEDIMGELSETPKGDAIRYVVCGMEYMVIAKRNETKEAG